MLVGNLACDWTLDRHTISRRARDLDEDLELDVHRHGFIEETHFTVAYSPVPDATAAGGIGGVLATVHEITQQVIQERRVRILRDLSAAALETRTVESACASAAAVLNFHPKDTPLALLYLFDEDQKTARLVAGAGPAKGTAHTPSILSVDSDNGRPLAEILKTNQSILIEDLPNQISANPAGGSDALPKPALLVPIRSHLAHRPLGIVVFGISPKIALDDLYRSFFDLAAAQIATAISNARAYEQERQRAEALAAIDRAKTIFFSNVSHEFRTPLTLILGPLEEALRDSGAQNESASRERLELIWRNSLRLQKLVNTLLDFSRIEAGRVEANYEPTDFSALTAQLAGMFESAITRAGLRLAVDCPPYTQPAYLDRDMWEKIVMNLLSNAVKFTLEGEIVVSVTETKEQFALTVRDTGVGIPADEIPRLFERFHRVRQARARTHEGTGIGLALVQELVRLHGGRIQVRSGIDRGTEFKIEIPTGFAHLPPDRIKATRTLTSTALGVSPYIEEALRWLPDEASQHKNFPLLDEAHALVNVIETVPCLGARVLVADDNADMRDYLRSLLGQYWNVETVADGRAALQRIEENRPELIISDVMMPGLDGFELLRSVRSKESTKDLPIILLSARAGDEAAVEALKAGADVYLVKPFAARELIAYVGGHLKLQRVRRQSLAVVRASEEKFSAAFDQSPLALTITSLDGGRLVEVNETFVRLTGYSREEAIGRTVDELKLWIEPEQRTDGLRQLRAGHNIMGLAARFRTKPGSELDCLIGSRMIEINGQSHVLSAVSDVTDLVRAEAIIAADLEAMTRLHQIGAVCSRGQMPLSECLDEILAVAIELTGADKGDIQLLDLASGALKVVAHRGFDEHFPGFFATLESDYPAACAAALRSGDRVFVNDTTQSEIFAGTKAQAALLAANVRAVQSTPLLNAAGNILGIISTHYATPHTPDERQLRLIDLLAGQAADYLQRVQAEEALHDRAEQLASLNAALRDTDRRKDEFLAMLGHELRNPLSAVRNAVAIASLDQAQRNRALEIARRQTDQLGRLIDDLLDVARVTQGRISLRKERVPLAEIIRRAIDGTQSFIAERSVTLETLISPEQMLLDADSARLEQVFVNLLTNAGKYTDSGGRIRLSTQREGATVAVRIRDNGIGISPELLPRIWDLFAQANRSLDRSQGGLGIGLTITRRLVELHGGRVEAHSDGIGKGAEFIVVLPLAAADTVAQSAEHSPRGEVGRSVRILLVEDNADAAETMTIWLELLGHRVISAADGLTGLAIARSDVPDIILVDIGLPGIDGYEVARRVRCEAGLKDVVLVALTGYGREEDKLNAIAAGFDYHLVKPVDPDRLSGLVANLATEGISEKSTPVQ